MPDELRLLRDVGSDVAEPDGASLDRARARLQDAIDAESGSRRARRSKQLRRATMVAVVVLVGAFGFGLGVWRTPSSVAGTSFAGVGFVPAKGWTVVQSGTFRDAGGPRAIAANVPLDPADGLRGAPVATLESLPPAGVLVSATFGLRGDPGADGAFPVRGLPLRMADADAVPSARRPARYSLRAGVGRYNVDARIYFGTASPSPAQLAVAQAQLDRLVVAADPVTISARPTILGREQTVTLFGSIDSRDADEVVTIEAKDCGQASYTGLDAVRTREGGSWSYELFGAGLISASYRAVWDGHRSAPVAVQARPYVAFRRHGSTTKYEVSIGAKVQFWHRTVAIQRLDPRVGTWKLVRNVLLTKTAVPPGTSFITTYQEFRQSFPKGTRLRAVLPLAQARPCYLAGYSNQVRI